MPITGACFCGAITYRIDGGLHAARACHCSQCRRAFSAASSAYALVEADTFHWVTGEDLLTDYVGQHGAGKQFCSRCGSMLTGTYQGRVHGVALGCVDGDPGVRIEQHLFVGSKAAWDELPEGIVAHHGFPPNA